MDPEVRFDALYRAHYGAVLRYAARRADPETARDVVAETFLVAWRRLSAVPAEPTEVEPWLYGVARKVLANALRSERRMQRVAARLGQHDRSTDVPDLAAAVTERARLAEALALLSEEDQEALRLVGWEELDLAGAARAMGCSRGAMAVRLHRARRRLKRALQATSGDVMSYGRMS
ncbi:MAG TPA: sigma-70 family RNA polymerase sigma factor [Streptosporangiaceae bacterium]